MNQSFGRILLIISTAVLNVAVARAQAPHAAGAATATISGRVTLDGAGAQGVRVILKPDIRDIGVSSGCGSENAPPVSAVTDAEGRYRLTGAPPGSCRVSVFAPTYVIEGAGHHYFRHGKIVNVAEGENVENVDFALTRGAIITGRVTDEKDLPASEHSVQVYKLNAGGGQEIMGLDNLTDDRGVYRIFGLEPGRYLVAVWGDNSQTFYPDAVEEAQARVVEVRSGDEAANIDIKLKIAPEVKGYVVTGRVVKDDTDKPVSGVEVFCAAITPGASRGGSAFTDSLGRFRFENLPPGGYRAYIFTERGGDFRLGDEINFEVIAGDVSGLEIRMRPEANISGVVAIEGSNDPSLRAKLARVNLIAVTQNGYKESLQAVRRTGNGAVSPNGTFKLSNVRPGMTRIITGPGSQGSFALLRVEHNGAEVNEFNVSPGEQITGVRLVFAYGSGAIAGRVEIKGGTPPPDMRLNVAAWRESGVPLSSPVEFAEVDGRGRFVIEGLAPGTYRLQLNGVPSAIFAEQTVTIAGEGRRQVTLVVDLTPKEIRRRP